MIKLVKMECPSCGGALEKKGIKGYKCSYCNSQYVMDMDVIVPVPAKQQKGALNPQKKAIRGICVICVIVMIIVATALIIGGQTNGKKPQNNRNNNPVANNGTNSNKGIKSPYFKSFVSQVFGKDADQVTEDELKEITYFAMDKNKYVVDYKINDGELLTVNIPNESSIDYQEIQNFPEIKVLKWDAYKERNASIKNLPKLEELTCSISPLLVLQYIPEPAQLTKLECTYYEEGQGVGEIEKFENLTDFSLTIHISALSKTGAPDLSGIAKMSKLQSIYLDNEECQSVAYLSGLTGLKRVNLHCDSLKDIAFLKELKNLEELTLVKCDILSVENLKYVPELKVLRLDDCYQIDSYEPVASLENLEELMLSYYYGQIVPKSFGKLKGVTRLTLEGFNDISFLSDFPNLTFLQLYGCNYSAFDKVSCMKHLKELKLGAGTNLSSVAALLELKELEKVDFTRMNTGADTEKLFMIPNIKELDLNDTEFAIDLNLIKKNDSLEILNIENLKWSAYNTEEGEHKYNYDNWQRLPMSECISFLGNFPNLKELSAQGNKLDSMDFVKGLTKLQKLDITNNYISDIQVLNDLPALTEVLCGENPINSVEGLDSRINVDNTTKATERWPFVHYDW